MGPTFTRLIVPLALVLFPCEVFAQEGTVWYDHTVTLQVPPGTQRIRAGLPGGRTTSKLLLFNESASIMKNAPEEAQDDDFEPDTRRIRVRMIGSSADEELYSDLGEELIIEKRDFLGRTFLITGERPALEWRLTDERSTFLGYLCQKATAMRDTVAVEVWFTPEIPVPAGPGPYGGLPGLILALNEDGGRVSFVASAVDLTPPDEGAIAPPTRGRELTREEFDAIVEQKMKEMGADGGQNVIIRRGQE